MSDFWYTRDLHIYLVSMCPFHLQENIQQLTHCQRLQSHPSDTQSKVVSLTEKASTYDLAALQVVKGAICGTVLAEVHLGGMSNNQKRKAEWNVGGQQ